MSKEDIVVIMGDAGFVWDGSKTDKYWQDFLDKKPWTTFCVLGNHEAYPLIEKLPIVDFHGTPARKVNDSIYYAISGEVYNLCGKKCLVVNGADSHDKAFRKEGKSWWSQEKITQDDANKALITLHQHNDKVDFIFTHTGGTEVCKMLGFSPTSSDFMLDLVLNAAEYDHAYCGHYHCDKIINTKQRIVYNDIIMIANEGDNL